MNKAFLAIAVLFMISCVFAQREEDSSLWGLNEEDVVEAPVRRQRTSVVKRQVQTANRQIVSCRYEVCQLKCRYPIVDVNLDCVVGACGYEVGNAFPAQCD